MAAMLKHTHSADILFSEEEPRQTFTNDDSFYSSCSSSARSQHRLKDARYSQISQPWPISYPRKLAVADPLPIRGRDNYTETSRLAAPIAQSYSASELSGSSHLFADDTDYSRLVSYDNNNKDDNANYKSGKTAGSGDLYSKSWCGEDTFVNSNKTQTPHSEIKEYRPCFSDTEGVGGGKTKYSASKYHKSIPTVPTAPYKYNGEIGGGTMTGLHSHSMDQFYVPPSSYNSSNSSKNVSNNRGGVSGSGCGPRNHQPDQQQNGLGSEKSSESLVEDLYTIPHTFDHQRVTRQPTVPSQTPKISKPPPKLTFPPPPSSLVPVGDRRRTWSPPTFSRVLANSGGGVLGAAAMTTMRSYRSNDQLDEVMCDVMEEEDEEGEYNVMDGAPPRLAPVSGKLQQNAHQSLIKPIAFKPVVLPVQQPHYGTTSRCPISPRQPLIAQRLQQQQQHPVESQEISPQGHTTTITPNTNLEKMRAKTLSPYELHSNSLNGSAINGSSYNSPPHHQQQVKQSTPKIVLYDRKVVAAATTTTGQTNTSHHDDGYISQDCHSGSHSHSNSSHSNTSHGSLHNDSDRSFEHSVNHNASSHHNNSSRTADQHTPSSTTRPAMEDRPSATGRAALSSATTTPSSSYRQQHHQHRSTNSETKYGQTPSPSDSGVGELEAMLRDKDAVIQHLRETMEKNEMAILQVCAEKEQNWDLELQQAHGDWERRWRQHQQKAFKMEQALLLQLFKLQQERKALRLDMEKSKSERESAQAKLGECMDDLKQTKIKLDEVNWDLCQKCGEISLLKAQLKDSKDEAVTKKNEVISTKSQLKNYQKTSDQKDHEILTLEAELKRVNEELKSANGTIISLQKEHEVSKKEVFNAQQKADLKELQLDMKTKELEKAHTEHSKRINALKSSPVAKGVNCSPPLTSPSQQKNEVLLHASPTNNNTHQGAPLTNGTDRDSLKSGSSVSSSSGINKLSPQSEHESVKWKAELDQMKAEFEKSREGFTRERDQWLEEKNKVIRYQKHLQLNYVQMYRKNKVLESEVEQLTLDLEKKDLSLMDSQQGVDKILEGEESMC